MDATALASLMGVIGIGLGSLFTGWFKGSKQKSTQLDDVTNKLLETYKNSITALEENERITRNRNHDLGNQITALTLKVGVMEGQIKEKDKKLEEYMAILQNRNPELDALIKMMGRLAPSAEKYMQENSQTLQEIKKFMLESDKRNNPVVKPTT